MEELEWLNEWYLYGYDNLVDPSKPMYADFTEASYMEGKLNHMKTMAQSNLFQYYRTEYAGSPSSVIFDLTYQMIHQLDNESLAKWAGAIRLDGKGKKK